MGPPVAALSSPRRRAERRGTTSAPLLPSAFLRLISFTNALRSGGRACKEAVDAHVRAAYDHFTTILQVPPSRVVIFGCSVGTGPASALAARVQASGSSIGALVLLSAYTSIRDAAASLVGAVAYIVLAERWDNAAALRTLTCPVLLLHGTSDEVIPFRQGEQLAELRRKAELPVVFFAQQGGTHNVYRAREDLSDPILAFLQKHHAQARPLVVRSDLGPKREPAVSPPAPSPRRRMPGGCLP